MYKPRVQALGYTPTHQENINPDTKLVLDHILSKTHLIHVSKSMKT